MSSDIETQLRATLHQQAAQVPPDAAARVTAHTYHPRSRRLRRPVALGALATATGTTVALVSLVGGTATAFAGWSPTPTRASAAQLATAKTNCSVQSPIAGLPLQLTDTRGPYTFEVYASDTASAVCISSPSFHSVSGMESSSDLTPSADTLAATTEHLVDQQGNAYSFADGRTGSGVTGVTLLLSDGTQVQATVQNGWFVAWWPSSASVQSAQLATPDGTKTQTIPQSPTPPAGGGGGNIISSSVQGGGAPGSHVSSFGSVSSAGPGPVTSTGSSTTASGTSTGSSTTAGPGSTGTTAPPSTTPGT